MGSTRKMMLLVVMMLLVDKKSLCQVSCCHEVWLTMRHHPVKQQADKLPLFAAGKWGDPKPEETTKFAFRNPRSFCGKL
jgi:hypothetical protein